jgi:hypothetical protein
MHRYARRWLSSGDAELDQTVPGRHWATRLDGLLHTICDGCRPPGPVRRCQPGTRAGREALPAKPDSVRPKPQS